MAFISSVTLPAAPPVLRSERVLLRVPAIADFAQWSRLREVMTDGNELILNGEVDSPLAEAFRRLRTVLTLSPQIGRIKRLLNDTICEGERVR